MMGLQASVRSTVPELSVELDVPAGQTVGVIGHNGAGKSTLLSILAGLRRTEGSIVRYGDRTLHDATTFVPAHRRSMVLLEQKARLFPHLDVRRNVGFGPASVGLSRREVEARVRYWLAATGVDEFVDRMPHQLSGGQAQRVALARALACEPDVLLLDEPFAALDVSVAQHMRTLLRGLLDERDGCTVLVTHDLIDAVSLADSVVVLESGRVADAGPTREVFTRPGTAFTAALSGLNLFVGHTLEASDSGTAAVMDAAGNQVVGMAVSPVTANHTAAAAFAPRAVAVYTHGVGAGSPRTALRATVTDVTPSADRALVRADCGGQLIGAEVTWSAVTDLGLRPGAAVSLVIKATEVQVYETH